MESIVAAGQQMRSEYQNWSSGNMSSISPEKKQLFENYQKHQLTLNDTGDVCQRMIKQEETIGQ